MRVYLIYFGRALLKSLIILVCVIILFVIALAVGAENDQLVTVHYLISQSALRLSSVMATMFIIGFVVACLSLGYFYGKARLQLLRLRRQYRKQQRELEQIHSSQNRD